MVYLEPSQRHDALTSNVSFYFVYKLINSKSMEKLEWQEELEALLADYAADSPYSSSSAIVLFVYRLLNEKK